MICSWKICYSGFRQHEGHVTGISRLAGELFDEYASSECNVILRAWDDNTERLAERIKLAAHGTTPHIQIFGYSWGGFKATKLCRALQKRGIKVADIVLCDAVYRHESWLIKYILFPFYMLFQWRALAPWRRIRIPSNVQCVHWCYQTQVYPRGHRVVAERPNRTVVAQGVEINATHYQIDDHHVFREMAMNVAGLAR